MTPYQNQDFYMPDSNEEAKKSSGQEIFKKSISDFDSAQISTAHEMDIRISDMIIHEMMPQA